MLKEPRRKLETISKGFMEVEALALSLRGQFIKQIKKRGLQQKREKYPRAQNSLAHFAHKTAGSSGCWEESKV